MDAHAVCPYLRAVRWQLRAWSLCSLKSATTGLCGEARVSVLNFYHEFAEQYPPNIIKTHEEEMNNFQL